MNCENCKFPESRCYIVRHEPAGEHYWQSMRRLCASCASHYMHVTEITEEQAAGLCEVERHEEEDAANIAELEKCLDEWGDGVSEIETCVCGNDDIYVCSNEKYTNRHGKVFFYIQCEECLQSTAQELYTDFEQVDSAWQTMQRSLKSGWTSEVPTEEGRYLFKLNGEQEIEYVVSELGYNGITLYFDFYNGEEPCTQEELQDDGWMGLWFRINYPEPPKE